MNFARYNRADVVFPDDGHRKKRAQSFVTRGTKIDGCVCPVCRKGGVLESPQAFFCSRAADGCHFTLWKDCLTRGGGPMLTEKLLRLLLENTNLVVTRETILQVVWGTDISVESRTVDMHISTLRKKLGDAGKYICTVRKVGYKLTDEEEAGEE